MRYEELREEWEHSYTLREKVHAECGRACCNCGSEEAIEYHHIVPLKLGGTNRISNIVALCHSCHCAAHRGRHISAYQNKEVSGRPIKEIDDDYFEAYVNGMIGTSRLKELAEISKSSHITDLVAFKKYKEKHNIEKIRNNIDTILKKRGSIEKGDIVGTVRYKDGTKKTIRFTPLKEYCGCR